MNRTQDLAQRLREVLLEGHWIANTNYQEQLLEVNWHEASHKVGALNTIADLTYHVNYYLAGLIKVLQGGTLDISDQYSFELPEMKSEADWNSLVNDFLQNAEIFTKEIEQMPDEKLDRAFVEEQYGNYWRNLEGVVEHSYYHLGQIVLLRKLMSENKAEAK